MFTVALSFLLRHPVSRVVLPDCLPGVLMLIRVRILQMQVNELCPRADQVEKLTAPCAGDGGQCCNRATFTWRMVAAHQQELVGGKESYQPLCRAHYLQHAAQRIQQQRASLDDALRS